VRCITSSPVYRRSRGPAASSTGTKGMDVSADGQWGATVVPQEGLRLWNLNMESAPEWFPCPGVRAVCFDPAGTRLFAGRGDGLSVHEWRDGGAHLVLEPAHSTGLWQSDTVDQLVFSRDGRRMARVNLAGGRIWIASPSAPEQHRVAGGQNSTAKSSCSPWGTGIISLSPDGKWLVSGWGGDAGVTVYEAQAGQPVAKLSSTEGDVQFSPDGRWLVLSRPRNCGVFRTGSWEPVWEKADLPVSAAATAAFSPDGNMLAAPDSATSIALWETASGRRLASLEAPEAVPVTVVRWPANGERLVCGTRAQDVEVWEIPALARELAAFGLGWDQALPVAQPPAAAALQTYPFRWLAASVLIAGCGAAGLLVLSLRRHRHLIDDIARSEALAATRERELAGAREINRLKSNFVSMVSHEFRTPLAVILSSTDILTNHLERLSPGRRAQQLDGIRGSTQQMARLIEEVLLLGKVEAGKMTFIPKAMHLRQFCSELVDEALSATANRCPITLHCTDDLPETIHADPALLRHIFTNLLSNAAKYSPKGAEVSLHVGKSDTGLVFRVTDQGIGIPAEDQAHIFEPFHRAGNVGQISGTGLGLMITKRCVELHGGSILLQSTPGEGTTVEVRLPE
jgi:signal transduction histidine kinase